jgi:hypothetical protein
MVRWFNFGRDNLHRPDTITHFGACLAEDLRAFLRTFAGVGDDLNRMFRNFFDFHVVASWPVQFCLLPVPEELKIKILRLLYEDVHSNLG